MDIFGSAWEVRGSNATDAERWWSKSPRALDRELLPAFPEVRNGVLVGMGKESTSQRASRNNESMAAVDHGYGFDFDGQGSLRQPEKRPPAI